MNTFRIAAGIAGVAAITVLMVTACSDRTPPTSTAIAAGPVAVSTGGAASLRSDARRSRHPIPDRQKWLGEEHNRVMLAGIADYRRARTADPKLARRMRADCEWTLGLVEREFAPSVARGGVTPSEGRALLRTLTPDLRNARHCKSRRSVPLAVFAAPFAGVGIAPHSMRQDEGDQSDVSETAWAAVDQMIVGIESAAGIDAVYTAIDAATAAAGALTGPDADAVFAAASVARGSADFWTTPNLGGQFLTNDLYAMSMFQAMTPGARDAKTVIAVDVAACVGAYRKVSKALRDWRPRAAGCLMGAAFGSFSYVLM